MLVHSVRRVPLPKASTSHRISLPPQLYSSTLGASARVTVVSVTCGAGAPTVVSFTARPTIPRLRSASKGAHSRRCSGSVSACQTFSGEWRSSLTRMSSHFSPSLRTFACIGAPPAGPGVYCSRSVIFFSSVCLLAHQLRDLNQIAAGVVQHGDLGFGLLLWSRSRFGPHRLLLVLLFRGCWLIRVIHVIDAVEVAFESIHVIGPEPAERSQPGIQLLKWFRFQPVETALCVHRRFHETGVAQHSQVL